MCFDPNYDDARDFYGEDYDCDEGGFGLCQIGFSIDDAADEDNYDDVNESMDGDFDSAMTSAGFGTDEDYGYYGEQDYDYGE